MFYDKKNLNNFLLRFQTSRINNSFNFLNYYFFLTNNYILFSNLTFFFSETNFNYKEDLLKINIKKNNYFFFKFSNKYRKYFYIKNILFKNKIKFNKFFKLTLGSKPLKTPNLGNFLYYPLKKNTELRFFSFHYYKIFYRNWNYILGNLISPYYWDLYKNKKSYKQDLSVNFIKNIFYFNKSPRLNKTKAPLVNDLTSKKIYLNNYFYFKKFNINYNRLNFLLKINNNFYNKNYYDWFFSKPYLFLNSYEFLKSNNAYTNYLTLNVYKNYLKFFGLIKKFNYSYKLRNTTNLLFKNFFTYSTLLSFSRHNSIYSSKRNFFGYFSFFKSSNLFSKNYKLRNKKKFLKKKIKLFWLFKSFPKTKVYKKHKFFYNLSVLQGSKLKKLKKNHLLLLNISFTKLTRRLKKLHVWNTFSLFYNLPKSFKTMWLRKSIRTVSNNVKFVKKQNYFKKTPYFFKNLFFKSFNFSFKLKELKKNKQNFFSPKNSYVFSNLKKSIFFSKERTNYITSKYGFFFTTDYFNSSLIKFQSFYNLKKLMFSFSYKNEIQRFILKKYIRSNFLNNIYNTNINSNLLSFNTNDNRLVSNHDFNFFDNFFKKNNESLFILNQNFFYSTRWTYFTSQINYSKTLVNDESNFIIKRVRFKPGYMNMWREVRSVLKTSLNLKFKYQNRLTNYLTKYNKFINFKTFLIAEMSLLNLLIRSRLIPDQSLCILYTQNNLIYLNGFICCNPHLQVFVGDFLQLIISFKYYILYKWFLNLSLKKKNRLKKISQKKMVIPSENDEKKRSFALPKWVLFSKNSIDDVVKYLEVDYFTLSALVLYEPFLWSDINSYNLLDQRFGIINLYNWKYIT